MKPMRRKIMAENTLSSKYNPQEVEAGRYKEWLENEVKPLEFSIYHGQ